MKTILIGQPAFNLNFQYMLQIQALPSQLRCCDLYLYYFPPLLLVHHDTERYSKILHGNNLLLFCGSPAQVGKVPARILSEWLEDLSGHQVWSGRRLRKQGKEKSQKQEGKLWQS